MDIKVLHVIPSAGPLQGGPSFAIDTMTRELARAGLDVHVATTDDNGKARLDVPLGVAVENGQVTYWYFRRQMLFYTFSWRLGHWLGQNVGRYDIVHIHGLFSFASIPASFWASRCNVPYIVRPLGTLNRWGIKNRRPILKQMSLRLIERRILDGAAKIHYTTELEQTEAAELGISGHGMVIPLGVDLRLPESVSSSWLAQRAPWLADRTVVLFLSRLHPKKGIHLLLRAFATARKRHPELALVLAGQGEPAFEAALRSESVSLGIDQQVWWAGFLAGDEKLAALASADMFILPSYSENFGIAAVEAMACELPVVLSENVGIYRDVVSGDAGIVVPCDETAIAEAIERLAARPDLRQKLGANGASLVRGLFSAESTTRALIETYKEIIESKARLSDN